MGDRLNRLRRLFESIRTRMLVGFVALLVFGLVAAILLTRYVALTDADREIEVEQAQEVEELRCFAMGGCQQPGGDPITDVETLFRAFLATNVPTDEEGHYTISDAGYFYGTGSPDLFADPQFDPGPIRTLARQLGARVVVLDPLNEAWAKNMRHVAEAIRDALQEFPDEPR